MARPWIAKPWIGKQTTAALQAGDLAATILQGMSTLPHSVLWGRGQGLTPGMETGEGPPAGAAPACPPHP